MIQRIQSLLFLFSTFFSLAIIYDFPVLYDNAKDANYLLSDSSFLYARLSVFLSALLSFYAIFQFKNRKIQLLISRFSRLMLTIALCLIVFIYKENGQSFGLGMLLLFVPFIFLLVANFFINRDDKLVKSADRIR